MPLKNACPILKVIELKTERTMKEPGNKTDSGSLKQDLKTVKLYYVKCYDIPFLLM